MSYISSSTLSGFVEKFTTDSRLVRSQSLPRFSHFSNMSYKLLQLLPVKQSLTVQDGNWFITRVAYSIFPMTHSWATSFVFLGSLLATIFIVSDPLSGFQKALDQSKLIKYVDSFLTFSSHIGFGIRSSIHNTCRQRQLRGNGVPSFCWLSSLSLLTASTISHFSYC